MKNQKFCVLLSLWTIVSGSVFSATHDLGRDYSTSANPNGVWSYGSHATLGGSLNLLEYHAFAPVSGSDNFDYWAHPPGNDAPAVWHNGSTNDYNLSDGGFYPAGSVWFESGYAGTPKKFLTIRFTVPPSGTGTYLVESAVHSRINGPISGDYDFHVFHNGTELLGQFLPGNSGTGYTNSIVLNGGDTLDFVAGPGNDDTPYGSGVRIKALISLENTNPAPPVIVLQPQSQTVVAGNTAIFTVAASGSSPLSYQWFYEAAEVSGANNASLVLSNVQSSAGGNYFVAVSNSEGSATSAVAVLTVTPRPTYDLERDYSTINNPNGVWSYGGKPAINGAFTLLQHHGLINLGPGEIIDYWLNAPDVGPAVFHNGGAQTHYSDGGQGNYPPGSIWYESTDAGTPGQFGSIRFTVPAGGAGSYRIETAVRSRLDGPISGDFDFHVALNGAELFGIFLPGNSATGYTNSMALADGDSLDFLVGPGQNGSQYGSGVKIKSLITRESTNQVAPAILSQPHSQTVIAGGNVSFNVTANGSAPLSYQWLHESAEISGANGTSLNLTNVQSSDQGGYAVIVSNSSGSVTSEVAVLTVTPPPTEATYDLEQDYSASANPNGVWSYGSQPTLGGSLSLLDYHAFAPVSGSDNFDYWAHPPGNDAPALWHNGSPHDYNLSDGGFYPAGSVWFESGYGGTPKQFCTIRFTVPHWGAGTYLVESAVHSRINGPISGNYDFHVLHNGTELLGQFLPGNSGTGYTNSIVLSAGDTLDFVTGPGLDGSPYGSGVRIKALISLESTNPAPPVIVMQPQSQTVVVGGNVTLSVAATGTRPLSYQWYFEDAEISGATSSTLTLNNVESSAAGSYTVLVSNSVDSVTSDSATLTVNPPQLQADYDLERDYSTNANPNAVWSYGSQSTLGGSFTLLEYHAFVPAGGSDYFDYWAHPPGSGPPAVWHNAGSQTHFSDDGQGVYPPGVVFYESGYAADPQHFATIRFTVPHGGAGTYRVETAVRSRLDGPVSGDYDWHVVHNGAELFGVFMPPQSATGYSNEVTLAVGDILDFAVGSGSDGSAYGSGIKIKALLTLVSTNPVSPEPVTIVKQPEDLTVSAGASAAFVVTVAGTGPFAYQWFFNGSPIPGGTNSTLGIANAQPSHSGEYRVQVGNWAGIVTSSNAVLTVHGMPPSILNPLVEYSAVVGGNVTLSISANGSAPLSYQWFFNGGLIAGATAKNYTISYVQMSHAGTYNVVVSNPFGSATNVGAVLTVSSVQGSGGTINFSTAAIRVYDVDGVTRLPVGSAYLGQLYAGPDGGQLGPAGAAVPVGPVPGIFSGGTRVITNVAPGQVASVQVKVWESAYGSNYEQARANGGKTGTSIIAQVTTSNPNTYPPQPPAALTGLANFALVAGVAGLPPAITSDPVSQTVPLGAPVSLTASASGPGVLAYQWQLNGSDVPGGIASTLAISHAQLADAGEYRVIVSNGGGSATSQVAVLTVIVERTLAVVSPPDQVEGGLVEVPLVLESSGDVAGMTIVLNFNADYLALTEVVWGGALEGAFKETSSPTPGQLRAVIAQIGNTIPASTQELARVNFHARTVPTEATSELNLGVIEMSDGNGDPIPYGTAVRNGSAHIIGGGQTLGDNNANGRLDVGDATLLLRMLAQTDTTRSWDVPSNDFNTNNVQDSGDVIRMLRSVSTPPPSPSSIGILGVSGLHSETEAAVITPSVSRGGSGELVRLQVSLQNIETPVAAASFTLNFPPGALRLANAQAYRVGPLVAPNAAVVWNVATPGRISLAVSSSSRWAGRDGVLAEITFQVLPGAASQYAWPLTLSGVEITPDGYTPRSLPDASGTFVGRAAVGGRLAGVGRNQSGQFELTLGGDTGASYVIEASTDLLTWTPLSTVVMQNGGVQVVDPDSANFSRRFYRARPVQ